MFRGFTAYDDEGYFLISLKGYLAHAHLYNSLYAQYGPFYFQFYGTVFRLLHQAPSHDVGRLITLVLWICTSLLVGISLARLTGLWILGVIGQLVVFRHLADLRYEPLHPGGLTSLLIAIAMALLVFGLARRPSPTLFIVGVVVAASILVKLNVGALLAFGLVYVVWCARREGERRGPLVWLAQAGFVALPIVATAPLFGTAGFARFGLVVSLCFASAAVWTTGYVMPLRRRQLCWAPIGVAVATSVILVLALLDGSSPPGLVRGILLDPQRQLRAFVFAPSTGLGDLLFAAAGLCGALICRAFMARSRHPWSTSAVVTSALARVSAGVFILHSLSLPLPPLGHAGTTFGFQLGAVWIALVPRLTVEEADDSRLLRVLICSVALLQVLHAYPVAGSQVAFGTFLLVLVGGLCIADGVTEARSLQALTKPRLGIRRAGAITLLVALLLGVPSLLTLDGARQQAHALAQYESAVPLDLAGARLLKVDSSQRTAYQAIVRELQRRRCKTFLTLPGLNSLYLWAKIPPPTFLNATSWMTLFDNGMQQRIIKAVDGVRDLCVVRNQVLLTFWRSNSRDKQVGPLERYIDDEFVVEWRSNGFASFEVMVRRP